MTLSCKEVTATMAQELEQPIYVKPNLIAENGKPFQGNLEYFFYIILLIYREILRMIRNG